MAYEDPTAPSRPQSSWPAAPAAGHATVPKKKSGIWEWLWQPLVVCIIVRLFGLVGALVTFAYYYWFKPKLGTWGAVAAAGVVGVMPPLSRSMRSGGIDGSAVVPAAAGLFLLGIDAPCRGRHAMPQTQNSWQALKSRYDRDGLLVPHINQLDFGRPKSSCAICRLLLAVSAPLKLHVRFHRSRHGEVRHSVW